MLTPSLENTVLKHAGVILENETHNCHDSAQILMAGTSEYSLGRWQNGGKITKKKMNMNKPLLQECLSIGVVLSHGSSFPSKVSPLRTKKCNMQVHLS